ncbi:CocE/NonD family hydrolase [Nonomuraea sp. NPDC050536]|uniref:CocE/NonD family hydrolase n=1 Tax=Nonomuraea sp. NPDC050536 TaxID=3364366 RepID=UPI0037C7A506
MITSAETMTARDGVELAATLWRPAAHGRFPVLLSRTPYGRAEESAGFHLNVARLVEAGYAVALQDVRGTGDSAGRFEFLAHEAEDGHDAVRWAATAPWSDGNVGMYGDSYLGITQLLAAQEQPEGLRAIAPHVTPAGLYEIAYRHGIPHLNVTLTVAYVVFGLNELQRRIARGEADPAALERYTAVMLSPEHAERDPISDQPMLADLAPFFAEWMDNPDPRAELWKRAVVEHDRIRVPALMSTGWYDYFAEDTIAHFQRLDDRSRLIVGPWTHFTRDREIFGRDYGDLASQDAIDWTGIHLDWFGQWLRGEPMHDHDRVRYFVMGGDEWRTARHWPPREVRRVPYHLGQDGTLGTAPKSGGREFVSDPGDPVPTLGGAVMVFDGFGPLDQRPLDGRADVLRYQTEPLTAAVEVAGPVELVARVSTSATAADVTAKLIDVHPDGRAELLIDGIARVSDTGETRVELGEIANRFLPGHRIRVDVAGSNFPRFARNPHKGTTTVHAPSYLVLPISS